MLHAIDWAIIAAYLLLALGVGLAMRGRSSTGRRSYFLADRSLPWWWAGVSIAATTFAADTPLAVAGIIASRGISGNWLWLSWILVHAGVVAVFARRWWRSDVVTDAEFISRRYNDAAAGTLRTFRAGLYGLVYNVIILGWVLRAMGKIAHPLVPWEEWAPGLTHAAARFVPEGSALGGPGEFLTILVLVLIVTLYSSLGGIRGVVRTDLVQFALGMVGSIWLAVAAWRAVGGRAALHTQLQTLYGAESTDFLRLFPALDGGWVGALGLGAFTLGAYLLVQGFANIPADGGGYLQQRLSACRSETDAVRAAWLFVALQYLVRVWPWFVVGVAALVLIPLGDGTVSQLSPDLTATVRADREAAWPALMIALLPPGVLGLLVVALLAAFMSTIDTHFNWGASYAVSDVFLRLRPGLSPRTQVTLGRATVVGFAVLALLVAMQIETIEQAWTWVAALGAALGAPTLLRWLWWRVTAFAELAGAVTGLTLAAVTAALDVTYERQLVWIASGSLLVTLAAIALGPRAHRAHAEEFARTVDAPGIWPGRTVARGLTGLGRELRTMALVVVLVLGGLMLGHRLLFVP